MRRAQDAPKVRLFERLHDRYTTQRFVDAGVYTPAAERRSRHGLQLTGTFQDM